MAKNPKPVRLEKRRHRRDRRRRWYNRVHKFSIGDIVCACGGHGVIKSIEPIYRFAYYDRFSDIEYVDTSEPPIDLELTLEDGRSCSAWSCGIFKVTNSYKDQCWCPYCGYENKNKLIQAVQSWYQPATKGKYGYYAKLSKNSTYADKRSFYLFCLRYKTVIPKHVIKSLQRDLSRLRSG